MDPNTFDRRLEAVTAYFRKQFLLLGRKYSIANLRAVSARMMELGLPAVVPALMTLLADTDGIVRLQAAWRVRLTRTNAPRYVRPDQNEMAERVLVLALQEDDLEQRLAALLQLGFAGLEGVQAAPVPADAIPLLEMLLPSPDPRLRVGAAAALLRTDSEERQGEVVSTLTNALTGNDPYLCTLAAEAFGRCQIKTKEAAAQLGIRLQTAQGDFRLPLVNALRALGTESFGVVQTLLEVLRDLGASASLRAAVANTVGVVCGPPNITDPTEKVQTRAAVRAALLAATKSSHPSLMWGAVDGLQASGGVPPEVIRLVINLLDSVEDKTREMAALALREIRPMAAGTVATLVERLEKELSSSVCAALVHALGVAGESAVVPLVEVLRRQDPRTVVHAAEALLNLEQAAVPEIFRLLLPDANERIREIGVAMAFRFGPRASGAVPVARQLLSHPDPAYRVHGAMALSHIGVAAGEAVPALIGVLADEETEVVLYAERALSLIGPDAVPHLRAALQDGNPKIRERVARLLAPYGGPSAGPAASGFEWVGNDNQLVLFAWVGQKLLKGPVSVKALGPELEKLLINGKWKHCLPTNESTIRDSLEWLRVTLNRGMSRDKDVKLIHTERKKTCGLTAEGKETLDQVLIYLKRKGLHVPTDAELGLG